MNGKSGHVREERRGETGALDETVRYVVLFRSTQKMMSVKRSNLMHVGDAIVRRDAASLEAKEKNDLVEIMRARDYAFDEGEIAAHTRKELYARFTSPKAKKAKTKQAQKRRRPLRKQSRLIVAFGYSTFDAREGRYTKVNACADQMWECILFDDEDAKRCVPRKDDISNPLRTKPESDWRALHEKPQIVKINFSAAFDRLRGDVLEDIELRKVLTNNCPINVRGAYLQSIYDSPLQACRTSENAWSSLSIAHGWKTEAEITALFPHWKNARRKNGSQDDTFRLFSECSLTDHCCCLFMIGMEDQTGKMIWANGSDEAVLMCCFFGRYKTNVSIECVLYFIYYHGSELQACLHCVSYTYVCTTVIITIPDILCKPRSVGQDWSDTQSFTCAIRQNDQGRNVPDLEARAPCDCSRARPWSRDGGNGFH